MPFKNSFFKPGEMGQLTPWLQCKHKQTPELGAQRSKPRAWQRTSVFLVLPGLALC